MRNAREIRLFDIPTTLLSSKIAIEEIFSRSFRRRKNIFKHLESREIANFARTLQLMVRERNNPKDLKLSVLE